MTYYASLYLTYLNTLLKTMSQYRADFFIMVVSALLHDGSALLFLTIIFANIQQLQGWAFHEVLLIFGLAVTARSLWNLFLDIPHRISWYIRSGNLDIVLVRPPAPLFQIAGEAGIYPAALGRVLVGLAAMATAFAEPTVHMAWWWALYIPLAILSGVLVQFSVNMVAACLSFWFTNVYSLLTTVAWVNRFAQYPINIFAPALQFVFTWILPFAMMGYFQAAFLLRGEPYRVMGFISLLMGPFMFGLTLAFWRIAVRRYQSTGS